MRDARDAELRRQRGEIAHLRRSQEELAAKVESLQEHAVDRWLQIFDRFRAFEAEMRAAHAQGRALTAQARVVRLQQRQIATQAKTVQVQRRKLTMTSKAARVAAVKQKTQIQNLTSVANAQRVSGAVTSVQSTAYGQRGSLFATNNLMLAGNQIFWAMLDPALRRFGVDTFSPGTMAWASVVGAFVGGEALMLDRQHVRFVTGEARFDGNSNRITVGLRSHIALGLWPDFQARAAVPATVTAIDRGIFDLAATVRAGVLTITGDDGDSGDPVGRVAWSVDTGEDVG